ncbi:MAG: hypothetical protein NZM42_01100 [Gemmatales bacterium]|nr:hypothetical protein [Gemmatales bacterium]MDW8221711.1 hypothetical protein [Gemmatales bacterium]
MLVFVAWMNLIRHRPREWSVEMWHALEAGLVVALYRVIAGAVTGGLVGYLVYSLKQAR